jgi:hypothetical protein
MNWLDLIPRSILGIIIIALMTTNFSCAIKNGKLEMEVQRSATKLAEAKKAHFEAVVIAQAETEKVSAEYRAKEQALQVALNKQLKDKDETFAALASQRDALRVRLSAQTSAASAPSYPLASRAPAPTALAPGNYITLFPGQVDQLIDEAYRADKIREELLSCYGAYDRAFLNSLPAVQTPASQ